MSSTRESLLAALKDPGNPSAERRFVEVYKPTIVDGLRSRGLLEAEDIAQEVLMRLLQRLSAPEWQYDPNQSFRGYIRVCVRNAFIDVMRSRKKHVLRAGGGSSARDRMENAPAPASPSDADGRYLPEDSSQELASQIAADLYREAERRVRPRIRCRTWELYQQWRKRKVGEPGHRAKKLAGRFDISENAVHKAWSRVRQMLREELGRLMSQQRLSGE